MLIYLKGTFPKSVAMDIKNKSTSEIRTEIINIRYDSVLKYCDECKMQGHGIDECKSSSKNKSGDKVEVIEQKRNVKQMQISKSIPLSHEFKDSKKIIELYLVVRWLVIQYYGMFER